MEFSRVAIFYCHIRQHGFSRCSNLRIPKLFLAFGLVLFALRKSANLRINPPFFLHPQSIYGPLQNREQRLANEPCKYRGGDCHFYFCTLAKIGSRSPFFLASCLSLSFCHPSLPSSFQQWLYMCVLLPRDCWNDGMASENTWKVRAPCAIFQLRTDSQYLIDSIQLIYFT